jgi:hypothetical protein
MSTIMISILPEGMPVDKMEATEDGESCPLPTQDSDLNEENMTAAVDEYNYSKCTNVDKCCATCSMYNQTDEIKECIEDDSGDTGYCQLLKFVCKSENTCSEWVEGEAITSNPQEEYKDIL